MLLGTSLWQSEGVETRASVGACAICDRFSYKHDYIHYIYICVCIYIYKYEVFGRAGAQKLLKDKPMTSVDLSGCM